MPGTPNFEQGVRLLKYQRARGQHFLDSKLGEGAAVYFDWCGLVNRYLLEYFGNGSFQSEIFKGSISAYGSAEYIWQDIPRQLAIIDSLIIELDGLSQSEHAATQHRTSENESNAESRTVATNLDDNSVFLVHGHDDGAKDMVARFLERLGLRVTILREQANRGRTIIEKFEDYSKVSSAVILLTGDDRGGLKAERATSQRPRARQNVILELGFFLGRLSRERVFALYEQGVEIPSDYQGVLFTQLDKAGVWRQELIREMQAAKLPIDLSRI